MLGITKMFSALDRSTMIQKTKLLLVGTVALIGLALAMAGPPTVARADDVPTNIIRKVVCWGDSITKRGYPQILGELLEVEAVNAGVAGNTSREGLRRAKKDVFAHHPDVVVIFFGTNDLRVDAPKKYVQLDEYKLNLEKMIKACRSQNAKVVLCTLPPIDAKPYFTRHEKKLFDELGGLETLVDKYRAAAIEVAKQTEVPLVDLNQSLQQQPLWISRDGVHPSKEGNRIIAKLISSTVGPLLEKQVDASTQSTDTQPQKDNTQESSR